MSSIRLLISLLAVPLLPLSAQNENTQDQVNLKHDNTIFGSVTNINLDGSIIIQSPLSDEPITILPGALQNIAFKKGQTATHVHKEIIYLRNGDVLPGSILSIDDKNISFATWYAGNFNISKDQVLKITFGNKPESIIFMEPYDLTKWKKNENWKSINDTLSITGRGLASNEFKLPSNFIIDFTLNWIGDNPRFKCNFCGNDSATGYSDRYFLDLNNAGIQLTRSSAQSYSRIGNVSMAQNPLGKKSVRIQIHVDRENQQISIKIDGKDVGTFDDPSVAIPRGNFITLESHSNDTDTLNLKNFRILEWGGNNYKDNQSDVADQAKSDTLYGSEGQNFRGQIQKVIRENDKLMIYFVSKHAKEPLKVPAERVATLFLYSKNKPTTPATPFWSELDGGGRIAFSSLEMKPDSFHAQHPILGKCTVKRNALHSLNSSAR